jgi:ribosomal protein L11 methyltransferase
VSFRVTVPCTRAQAEVVPNADEILPANESPPVLVADEPDAANPDQWLIHAYFDHEPTAHDIALVASLGSGPPQIEKLGEQDWVTMSQDGLQPIRAGRFTVHTPTCPPDPERINFEIDAGLAFGTGQHVTTAGCLEALDRLERDGGRLANVADIGTGTGLLAFAAIALWPDAKCIATDIDSQAINVARENAAINGVTLGHGAGELLLVVADGMHSPMLSARAPFDLIVANILAGPLIDLAPGFAKALMPGGVVVLAGLLDSQAEAVANAYAQQSLPTVDRGFGEWPVLVCKRDA